MAPVVICAEAKCHPAGKNKFTGAGSPIIRVIIGAALRVAGRFAVQVKGENSLSFARLQFECRRNRVDSRAFGIDVGEKQIVITAKRKPDRRVQGHALLEIYSTRTIVTGGNAGRDFVSRLYRGGGLCKCTKREGCQHRAD